MTMPRDSGWRQRMDRLNALLAQIDRFEDADAKAKTREMIQLIMDLHGSALERVLEGLAAAGETGMQTIDTIAQDDLVSGVLLLYGLHPLDIDSRVRQALDSVGPALAGHGGSVEMLSIRDGTVRLRLHGNCDGCPSSAATLKQTIEAAIFEKAPDVTAIEVVDEEGKPALPVEEDHSDRISLTVLAR